MEFIKYITSSKNRINISNRLSFVWDDDKGHSQVYIVEILKMCTIIALFQEEFMKICALKRVITIVNLGNVRHI